MGSEVRTSVKESGKSPQVSERQKGAFAPRGFAVQRDKSAVPLAEPGSGELLDAYLEKQAAAKNARGAGVEVEEALQARSDGGNAPTQLRGSSEKEENRTRMPDRLKGGLEGLSGMDLSEVRVHYNSAKPAEVGALAYTQGRQIYLGPGEEGQLPHEGWHAVQQMERRVMPTMQAGGMWINDDVGLEREADAMGAKALRQEAVPGPVMSVETSPGKTIQRKLGFEFEVLVNTDTKGSDSDPLLRVKEQDKTLEDLGFPGTELFKVVSDNTRRATVVDKSDFEKLDSAVKNRKILEIVTEPVDEFDGGARDKLAKQMDILVAFGNAIVAATQNLQNPTSLQDICAEFLSALNSDEYKVAQKDNVIIGRNQAALEKEGLKKSVQTRVQTLAASTHYTVGIDFERLPEYIEKLTQNPELSNKRRGGEGQKSILGEANTKVGRLMSDSSITDVDISGVEGQLKGFFLSVMINLLFGKIDQMKRLDKNFAPLLSRTDGVLILNSIDKLKNGVKIALRGNWDAIRAKIKALTGTNGSDFAKLGDDDFPTVDGYLNNLVGSSKDGFTQAFGGMKEIGPEDVGKQFFMADREKGIVYENRDMRNMRKKSGGRYELNEWKSYALRVFDEVKAVNTKASGKL